MTMPPIAAIRRLRDQFKASKPRPMGLAKQPKEPRLHTGETALATSAAKPRPNERVLPAGGTDVLAATNEALERALEESPKRAAQRIADAKREVSTARARALREAASVIQANEPLARTLRELRYATVIGCSLGDQSGIGFQVLPSQRHGIFVAGSAFGRLWIMNNRQGMGLDFLVEHEPRFYSDPPSKLVEPTWINERYHLDGSYGMSWEGVAKHFEGLQPEDLGRAISRWLDDTGREQARNLRAR